MNTLFKQSNTHEVILPLSLKKRLKILETFPKENRQKIDLYQFDLDKLKIHEKRYLDHIKLSISSYQRFNQYIHPHHQYHYLLRSLLLKELLSKYTHQERKNIGFKLNEYKKPFLDESYQLFFNMSYSEQAGLVGVSRLQDIGVDIERLKPLEDIPSLLDCFAWPKEKEWVLDASPLHRFYVLWTAKEALVKAMGTGFLNKFIPELEVLPYKTGDIYISAYKKYTIWTKPFNQPYMISYSYQT
tara:strand:+ start:1158 stop:1886 length:729 start_codon:yes stop_codon:yes gene_type:complete